MQITWTNCAEILPPDDEHEIYAKYSDNRPIKTTGKDLINEYSLCDYGDEYNYWWYLCK